MGQNEMGHEETRNGTSWNEMEDMGRCKGNAGDAYVSEGIKRPRGRMHAGIRNGAWDKTNVQYNVRRRGRGDGAERALSEGRFTTCMRAWNGKWDGPECGTWRNGPQQKASVS